MFLTLALRKVGDLWSLLVLRELLDGPRRFSEVQTAIPRISGRCLSRVLAKLQDEGVIRRTVTSARPPQVIYTLIHHKDTALRNAISALTEWGKNQ
jgi:DNA-binding HxlR family transcriptional regulator